MVNLTQGRLGWAKDREEKEQLVATGDDPTTMLARFADSFPKLEVTADPRGVVAILNQGNQGSCQGHSLAMMFAICFWLATGRWAAFSRAAAYYLSQLKNGLRGDVGSTLNGGNKVATGDGLCLELDWPYPRAYDPRRPASATTDKFAYKLRRSRPFTTVEEMQAWMEAGLPIQTGIDWNDSCNREVVDDWRPGGGGHSTSLWLLSDGKPNNINSWGEDWCNDGVQKWTWKSVERMLNNSHTVFIGYAPDEMMFPVQEPIEVG
jgi:hypothetical protein